MWPVSLALTSSQMDSGLILAFDLDFALIDSTHILRERDLCWLTIESYIHTHLNMNLVEKVLRPAIEQREKGRVSAILLITNNILTVYADCVEYYIARHFGILHSKVFDYMMMRQDPMRAPPSNNPPKRLIDIHNCLVKLGKPVNDLAQRTFFFDDSKYHAIKKDFQEAGCLDHYIQIVGPESVYIPMYGNVNKGFLAGKPDLTNYDVVLNALKDSVDLIDTIPSLCQMEISVN